MILPSDENVNYQVNVDAAQAIKNLRQLAMEADNADKKLRKISKGEGPGGSFGEIFRDMQKAAKAAKEAEENVKNLGESGQQSGQKIKSGFERAITGVNAFRIALGAVVAMLVFSVIQTFQTMVQGALKGLVEIEAAMFNIVNAEKKLSEQGVEISVQGLQQLIKDLKELNPMLSEFQATELISTIATKVAPAFGFGTKEIERMAKSITILAVRNQALGKSFEEVEQQAITGILSGKVTQGINQLGLKITDQIVKEEAVNIGLVKNAKAYDDLNAKAQASIS